MKSLTTWYLIFHILELSAVQAELHDDGMTQRVFFLGLIDELIGGRSYTGIRGRPSMERPPAEARFNRQLDHAPVKLATQSKCPVNMRRVDTLYACSVCNVRMCPFPCFGRYHYKVEYGYDDPKKAAAAPARKR